MTQEELLYEIATKTQLLNQTDYKALKHSEGRISDEDYAAISAQRQQWRDDINEAQRQLDQLTREEAPVVTEEPEPEVEEEPEEEPVVETEPTDAPGENGEW